MGINAHKNRRRIIMNNRKIKISFLIVFFRIYDIIILYIYYHANTMKSAAKGLLNYKQSNNVYAY